MTSQVVPKNIYDYIIKRINKEQKDWKAYEEINGNTITITITIGEKVILHSIPWWDEQNTISVTVSALMKYEDIPYEEQINVELEEISFPYTHSTVSKEVIYEMYIHEITIRLPEYTKFVDDFLRYFTLPPAQVIQCQCCIEQQGNQLAHMDFGGCLYSEE